MNTLSTRRSLQGRIRFLPRTSTDLTLPGTMKVKMSLDAFLNALHGIDIDGDQVVVNFGPGEARVLADTQDNMVTLVVCAKVALDPAREPTANRQAKLCKIQSDSPSGGACDSKPQDSGPLW